MGPRRRGRKKRKAYGQNMFRNILPVYPSPNPKTGNWDLYDLDAMSSLSEVAGPDSTAQQGEIVPVVPGIAMRHQRAISRIMSGTSTVRSLMLVHEVGTGKTCSAISAIERNIADSVFGMRHGIFLSPSKSLSATARREAVERCTTRFSSDPKVRALPGDQELPVYTADTFVPPARAAGFNEYYKFYSFHEFTRAIGKMSDSAMNARFNSTFIVIDEAHMLTREESSKYKLIDRFLRAVRNKKLLLLTGTPVKDRASDFAAVFNLMLDDSEKLDVANFEQKYIIKSVNPNSGTPVLKATDELVSRLAGRVSYLSADRHEIDVEYMGNALVEMETKMVTVDMSPFQDAAYGRAWKRSVEEVTEGGGKRGGEVAYLQARQAARFVFPDGTVGNDGFNNPDWIRRPDANSNLGVFTNKLIDKLTLIEYNDGRPPRRARTDEELYQSISKYSKRYAEMARTLIRAADEGEKSFVYDNIVGGSGLSVFAGILQLFGFKRGFDTGSRRSFEMLTGESGNVSRVIANFNDPSNATGGKLMVLLGSRALSTGITLKDVLHEHVVAHWNESETRQVIGRGIRTGSHAAYRALRGHRIRGVTVKVYRWATLYADRNPLKSIDVFMYNTGEEKRKVVDLIVDTAKQYSLTCRAFAGRNDMNPSVIDPSTGKPFDNDRLSCLVPNELVGINHENAVAQGYWDSERTKRLCEVLNDLGMTTLPALAEEMQSRGYEFEPEIDVAYVLNIIRKGIIVNPNDPITVPRKVLHDEDGIIYAASGVDIYKDPFMTGYTYRNVQGRPGNEQTIYEAHMVEYADWLLTKRVMDSQFPETWEFPPQILQNLIQDSVSSYLLGKEMAPDNINWPIVNAVLTRYRDFWCDYNDLNEVRDMINAEREADIEAARGTNNKPPKLISTRSSGHTPIAAVWYSSTVSSEVNEPYVMRLSDFTDPRTSVYTSWRPTSDSDELQMLMRVRSERIQDMSIRATMEDLTYTGRIHPTTGDFCLAATDNSGATVNDRRTLHVGKICKFYDKAQLAHIYATIHGRGDDANYVREVSRKRTREDICDELMHDFKRKELASYDTSCGVQAKVRH